MLRILLLSTMLAGGLAGSAPAPTVATACGLPADPGAMLGIMWQAESTSAPLPKEYLP